MANLKTWIDVADNAVKIGLGALIGGTFGVWVAWLNNNIQARRALNERRRQIVEGILDSVDGACSAASVYWSNVANAVFMRDKDEELTESDLSTLSTLQDKFFESFVALNSSAAKLLLLKELPAEAALQDLRTVLDAFFKIARLGNKNCTPENLPAHREAISTKRRAFYLALSAAHSRSV